MDLPKTSLSSDNESLHRTQNALINKLDFDTRYGNKLTTLTEENRDKIMHPSNIARIAVVSSKTEGFKLNISLPDATGALVWREISLV